MAQRSFYVEWKGSGRAQIIFTSIKPLKLLKRGMNPPAHIKEIQSLRYFTGNHPKIRSHFNGSRRALDFGNKVWATSHVLIDYLATKPFELQNLRVLEIGCGWGLVGVYLAKKFDCKVTCTDFDMQVLPVVKLHGDLNNVEVACLQKSFADLSEDFLNDFDLIVGAEVCYSDEAAQEIKTLIKRVSKIKSRRLLIADPGRPDFDDCLSLSREILSTDLVELPGSVNGKTTYLLSATSF